MARTMKQGSTWPPLRILLQDEDGPVNLTNADTIELRATGPVILTGTLVPDSGQGTPPAGPIEDHVTGRGWVEYDLDVGDTDNPGTYTTITKVTWAVGDIEYFPNSGSDTLTIEAVV